MIAHTMVNAALRAAHVPTTRKKEVSTQQKRIRAAAPRYMTEAQATALKAAGELGWTGRSIVADVKSQRCAVSIQNGEEVAWIDPDGKLRSEDDIVKKSGAV